MPRNPISTTSASALNRRHFLRLAASTTAFAALSRTASYAGPFVKEDFLKLIPPDKKLDPAWVASLSARGKPETFIGEELEHIGMPVGGMFTGTLYLGGDGRLWLWDIFNQRRLGLEGHTTKYLGTDLNAISGSTYVSPLRSSQYRHLQQGFSLTVKSSAGETRRTLDKSPNGFPDVSFTGEYPIGTVRYSDPSMPLQVKLEAFSPFSPHHVKDSSLPLTVFSFELTNTGGEELEVILEGLLENGAYHHHRDLKGKRHCSTRDIEGCTVAELHASLDEPNITPAAGSMCLALMGKPAELRSPDAETNLREKQTATLGRRLKLAPGARATVDFLITWHFPHVPHLIPGLTPEQHKRQYARDFANASEVASYTAKNFGRLSSETRLWRDTWYDSSLPYWFLNRAFANTSTLATSTCFLLDGGRFYADEGIGCCPGTCTHVWQYAQAPGRLFPEIERNHREFVDFGKALTDDGVVRFRAENADWFAIDGQAGRILGVYREHQMTTDGAFLKRVWPNVKKAILRMIIADKDGDGILHGPLHNTLDADWTGIVPWVNGMYHATLKVGEIMAREMGDEAFANQCAAIFKKGMAHLDKLCWREDYGYYVQIGDPEKPTEVGAYEGCHIDQVLGQAWAFQIGIGEVMTGAHARKCLESLWKYNFTPDVGPFRAAKKMGRWYAMPGEGGLIMLSNPIAPDIKFTGKNAGTQQYFNECMSGFEHQVAAHMMWENMVTESLAITRVIHDRYHPRLRNPYNEIECSDHYGRAMASYGTYLAACGYEYDGPKQHLGFAPRLSPDKFKAAFTSAEGWGTFSQQTTGDTVEAKIVMKSGKLALKTLSLASPATKTTASINGAPVSATVTRAGNRATVSLDITLTIGQTLIVSLA